jgi:hypothetical protein
MRTEGHWICECKLHIKEDQNKDQKPKPEFKNIHSRKTNDKNYEKECTIYNERRLNNRNKSNDKPILTSATKNTGNVVMNGTTLASRTSIF